MAVGPQPPSPSRGAQLGSTRGAWRGIMAGLSVGLAPAAVAAGSVLVVPYGAVREQLGHAFGITHPAFQPPLTAAVVALLLSALTGLLVYAATRRFQPVAAGAVLLFYLAVLLVAGRSGVVLDPLYTPLAILLAAGAASVVRQRRHEQERAAVSDLWAPNLDLTRLEELAPQGEAITDAMRRTVTVICADVRGYTSLAATLPPEEALNLLTDFLTRCSDIVFEHRGTVDGYVGDSVVAYWNAPVPVESHADRALEAALAITRSAAGALGERGLRVGVGICSGAVVLGAAGDGPRRGYTAIGEAVNVAAQLCSLAPAGVILIAEPTMRLLTLPPHATQVQPLRIKGFDTPLTAYAARPPAPVA